MLKARDGKGTLLTVNHYEKLETAKEAARLTSQREKLNWREDGTDYPFAMDTKSGITYFIDKVYFNISAFPLSV